MILFKNRLRVVNNIVMNILLLLFRLIIKIFLLSLKIYQCIWCLNIIL